MKGMLAPLSPHEETTLRKIAVGSDDCLEHAHVRRLHQLGLVENDGRAWRLTAMGARRHDLLMTAADASAA